jgi:CubicO group peptidase (beta-lactamase class C family)
MRTIALLCLALSAHVAAAPVDDLREYVQSERERLGIPGVSVALIADDGVHYFAIGVRRADEAGDVATFDAFNIGSISKTITAWAVMRLAELNLVSLDTPVEQYLDRRWRLPESEFDNSQVTLRRILSHTAGLSAPSYQGLPFGSSAISLEDSLNGHPVRSSIVRVIVQPGTEYRYSGGGYAIAQLVVESVTGRSFEDFVSDEIFGPLGMQHAEYLDFEEEPLRVSPHDYAGKRMTDFRIVEQGAGGLRASAQDLVNFISANMLPNPVLSVRAVNEMHEPVELIAGDERQTLGFARRGSLLSHGGHSRGWVAHIDFQPSSQSGLVILTNSANGLHFVQPVRCKWAELFEIEELAVFCEKQIFNKNVTDWTLGAVSASAILLAIWILWRTFLGLRNRVAEVLFGVRRALRSFFYIMSIAAIWTVLGTELGVYLATGVRWGLPTLGYFSIATQYAVMALTLLLGVVASTSFVTPKRS